MKIAKKKYFHWFVYKCVFNNIIINTTNNKVIFQVTLSYGENKVFISDELDVLFKKTEDRSFIFNQTLKSTMKIYSNLSNINEVFYLKLRIPILHRKTLQIISQNMNM